MIKNMKCKSLIKTLLFADHLLKQFSNENEATIFSKTSRWLATAKERSRHAKNYKNKNFFKCFLQFLYFSDFKYFLN